MYFEIYHLVQKKMWIIVVLLGCLMCRSAGADSTPDVPLGHPVYGFLDRAAARKLVRVPHMRPMSRRHVARLLKDTQVRQDILSQTERGLLDRYLAEFGWDVEVFGGEPQAVTPWLEGGPVWAWRDSVASVAVAPFFRQGVIAHRGDGLREETVSQTYLGGTVWGQFHNFGFRARHFEAREWSTLQRVRPAEVLAQTETVQLKGKSADFREGVFQLVWGNGWVRLDGGKGSVDWGPGGTGNLFLGSDVPTYGLFRLQTGYKNIRYIHLAGSLQARAGLYDTTRRRIDNGHVRIFLRQKRLAAHRLEVGFKNVTLGVQESVVYGDRGFEPLYVMPVTFFVAVQNHLENRDNVAMGFDLSWRSASGLELYGACFFDDLAKLSPSAFSNKFGLQTGVFWVDPLGLSDLDIRAEYVRLEPFVYSHNFDINTYEHYSTLLGHRIGPNADLWHVKMVYRFAPWMQAEVLFERERQGENPVEMDGTVVNVGGNAQQGRRPTDVPERIFMAGDVETHRRLGVGIQFMPIHNWNLQMTYKHVQNGNVLLPDDSRGQTIGHAWMMTFDVSFY